MKLKKDFYFRNMYAKNIKTGQIFYLSYSRQQKGVALDHNLEDGSLQTMAEYSEGFAQMDVAVR